MTPDERQALREKHADDGTGDCFYCASWDFDEGGYRVEYPCDVVKCLNQLDAIAMETTQYLQDVKIVPENIIDNIIKILDGVNES
jgi:hypothetical protein